MRIGIFTETYDPAGSPGQRLIAACAADLAAAGQEVSVLAQNAPGGVRVTAASTAVDVRTWPRPPWRVHHWRRMLSAAAWAQRCFEREDFDVTVSFSTLLIADIVMALRGWISHHFELRAMVTANVLHGALRRALYRANPLLAEVARRERSVLASPAVQRIVTPAESSIAWARRHGARQRRIEPIDVWPPPPPTASAPAPAPAPGSAPAPRSAPGSAPASGGGSGSAPASGGGSIESCRRELRCALAVTDDQALLLMLSDDPLLDGVDLVIEAAATASWPHRAVVLLAGEIGYREQRLAAEHHVRDRLRLMGHTRRHHELFLAADLTLCPARFDPSGRRVLESLSSGRPVIATQTSAAADHLTAGVDGIAPGLILPPSPTPEALAAAVAHALVPSHLAALTAAAVRRAGSHDARSFIARFAEMVLHQQ